MIAALLALMGFKLDNAIVPKEEIISGGPPKDGIPAILAPKFIGLDQADFLKPDDQVIGVRQGSQVKAYPVSILNWHEVVTMTPLMESPASSRFDPLPRREWSTPEKSMIRLIPLGFPEGFIRAMSFSMITKQKVFGPSWKKWPFQAHWL